MAQDIRPPRKQRLRDKNPERYAEIVKVATRVFATEGYLATSVNKVAEQANVGVGTLYSYFDDKDDLFLTCVQAAAATDLELKQARLDTTAPVMDALRMIFRVDQELSEIDTDGQLLLRSVFYGVNSHLPVGKLAQEAYSGSIDLVEAVLQRGIAEGVFDLHGETRLVALLLNGLMETFFVLRSYLHEEGAGKRNPVERAFELLCDGIFSEAERARRKSG